MKRLNSQTENNDVAVITRKKARLKKVVDDEISTDTSEASTTKSTPPVAKASSTSTASSSTSVVASSSKQNNSNTAAKQQPLPKGQIRVGRCTYGKKGKRDDPSFAGFTPIIVLTKSTKYGSLGPYVIKNEKNQIMENIWQFSKIYKKVPKTKQRYSRWDKTVIWEQEKEEVHATEQEEADDDEDEEDQEADEDQVEDGDDTGFAAKNKSKRYKLTAEYWAWRARGYNNPHAVRYPVGNGRQGQCIGAIYNSENPAENDKKFDFEQPFMGYIEARKKIYLPVYCELVKPEAQFKELKMRVEKGENLLIIEVDGPHQESLEYYKKKYKVDDTFIQNGTMLATEENIQIMLNDAKHAFGHGYCLAMALLGRDKEWAK